MKKTVYKILSCLLVVGMLTGCSTGGGKPTLVNQKSKEDAYETLMEAKLLSETETKDGKETIKMIAYVPETSNSSNYGDNAYSYLNGVMVNVALNSYYYEDGDYADDVVKEELEYIEETYDLIETISVSEITVDDKREEAYFEASQLVENYNYEASGVYKFVYAKELSKDQRFVLQIEIELDECNKNTAQVITELEEYYGIKLGFNQEELQKAVDEFNANPPATKTVSEGGLKYDIPREFDLDYDETDISDDYYAYGLDGDSYDVENNVSVMILSEEKFTLTNEELLDTVKSLLADDESGAFTVTASDIALDGIATARCTIVDSGIKRDGYVVNVDGYLAYVFTDGSETMPQEQLDVVVQLVKSIKSAY